MKSDSDIRKAQERAVAVYEKRPEVARSRSFAESEITDGLTCTVTQGAHKAVIDMPETVGGCERGPSPGFHARAAISGCVAIGIKMTAIRMGLALTSVKVGVEMEFDDGALFGVGPSSAAPLVTRIGITLESDADAEALREMVDKALAADPYFLELRDPQQVETRLEIV